MKEYRYEVEGKNFRVRIKEVYGDHAVVEVNDQVYQVDIKARPEMQGPPAQAMPSAPVPVAVPQRAAAGRQAISSDGMIRAPMPGVVLKVMVEEGDMVNAGDPVMVIEAMKMENEIKAPVSGTVKQVKVEPGDSVNTGDELMEISTE